MIHPLLISEKLKRLQYNPKYKKEEVQVSQQLYCHGFHNLQLSEPDNHSAL